MKALNRLISTIKGPLLWLTMGMIPLYPQGTGKPALFEAIEEHEVATIRELLATGADPNMRYARGTTPLIWAAIMGNTAVVELLVRSGARTDLRAEDGYTAAHYAATTCASVLEVLLKSGMNPDVRGSRDARTPLILAARWGCWGNVNAVIQAKAKLDAESEVGDTALMVAARHSHIAILASLLKAGADPDYPNKFGQTALMAAAASGSVAAVRYLASYKVAVNRPDPVGFTALMVAALRGRTGAAEALIAAGADLNLRTSAGQTALMMAAAMGHEDTVSRLLKAGADGHIMDAQSGTALGFAVLSGKQSTVELLKRALGSADSPQPADPSALARLRRSSGAFGPSVEELNKPSLNLKSTVTGALCDAFMENSDVAKLRYLTDHGADPNAQCGTILKSSILRLAIIRNNTSLVDLLLAYGAAPNASERGETPLMLAAAYGILSINASLLKYGADVNSLWQLETRKLTPLILATIGRAANPDVVQLLLDNGATIGPRDPSSGTALVGAAAVGQLKIVKLLLQHGADVNAKGNIPDEPYPEATPLMAASNSFNSQIVELLLKHGADTKITLSDGDTALIWATRKRVYLGTSDFKVEKTEKLKIVRLLLAAGSDPLITNRRGETARMIASGNGFAEIADLLKTAEATSNQ